MRQILFTLAILILSVSSVVIAQDTDDMSFCNTTEITTEDAPSLGVRSMMVLNGLQSGDTTAAEAYVSADNYIQHNLGAPNGIEGLLGLISATGQGDSSVNIHRVLVQGDMVVLHTSYNLPLFGGELVAFDVFRFEDGLMVEHWDNLQAVADPNPSGRTAVDGAIAITDLDQTQANCELVTEFVDKFLAGSDPTADITAYINPEQYLQHNPFVADGLDGLGTFLGSLAENNQVLQYSETHIVVAQGNFVLVASDGFFGDAEEPTLTAFYDLFRVEDGLIVEHWDVISPIPTQAEWANDNGKF